MVSWSGVTKFACAVEVPAVERDRRRDKSVAVEHESGAGPPLRVRPDGETGDDARCRRVEADIEIDRVDQIIRRPIVFQTNGFGDVGTHENL